MPDAGVCSVEGCTTGATRTSSETGPRGPRLELSVVSDTICPWCYVGKRRIERAIEALAAEGFEISLRWLPFELNPDMPTAGMDRRTYRAAKFGSWERSQALDAQVAAEGAREGIAFRHDRISRTPNTRASHRLIWLAGELGGPGLQSRVVEALFAAYFHEGRDIGDRAVLADIGASAGLDEARVLALLDGDDGLADVIRHEMAARSLGVSGVPTVMAGDLVLFSGAQRTPLVVRALREVASARQTPAVTPGVEDRADARP
jgi:predicted DsbA family dithiol-disulfide isomerase